MRLSLQDAEVSYYPDFLSPDEADELYRLLMEDYRIDLARRTIMAGGKLVETDSFKFFFASDRLIAKNSHPEHIHGKSYPFSGLMQALREKVEALTKNTFELAMCLYYPDGTFFAPDHFDQDTSGVETIIPSLSLGAVREFRLIHNDKDERYSLSLAHGSLLVMGKYCQNHYIHGLPKDPNCLEGRINITFREASFM